ncbi:Phospholipase A(2) [Eumeta japonica]|uniref:Phospholipase A2 n=1 Tax=Eumeta variegata TaxID=151549 RepID=A0A4C1SEJ9_EUMVA|nr:Phospholipase A(2) [Eumeta japonica]
MEVNIDSRFLFLTGTKWCGAGDVADNYDDLGPARETDVCCREHDHCPDVMRAGESRHNLTNTSYFTRLSCDCDETFRQCLHDANTTTANRVGLLYFDAIGTKCYREDYPITGCAKKGGYDS